MSSSSEIALIFKPSNVVSSAQASVASFRQKNELNIDSHATFNVVDNALRKDEILSIRSQQHTSKWKRLKSEVIQGVSSPRSTEMQSSSVSNVVILKSSGFKNSCKQPFNNTKQKEEVCASFNEPAPRVIQLSQLEANKAIMCTTSSMMGTTTKNDESTNVNDISNPVVYSPDKNEIGKKGTPSTSLSIYGDNLWEEQCGRLHIDENSTNVNSSMNNPPNQSSSSCRSTTPRRYVDNVCQTPLNLVVVQPPPPQSSSTHDILPRMSCSTVQTNTKSFTCSNGNESSIHDHVSGSQSTVPTSSSAVFDGPTVGGVNCPPHFAIDTTNSTQTKQDDLTSDENENLNYCLKWNNHRTNLVTILHNFLETESFCDVTLACDDSKSIKCHKIILSACSSYFESLFLNNTNTSGTCQNPIVFLKDIKYNDMKAILDYMYCGEVNVPHRQIKDLFKVAQLLKVKGLVEEDSSSHLNCDASTNSSQSTTPSGRNLSSSSNDKNDTNSKSDPLQSKPNNKRRNTGSYITSPLMKRTDRQHHPPTISPHKRHLTSSDLSTSAISDTGFNFTDNLHFPSTTSSSSHLLPFNLQSTPTDLSSKRGAPITTSKKVKDSPPHRHSHQNLQSRLNSVSSSTSINNQTSGSDNTHKFVEQVMDGFNSMNSNPDCVNTASCLTDVRAALGVSPGHLLLPRHPISSFHSPGGETTANTVSVGQENIQGATTPHFAAFQQRHNSERDESGRNKVNCEVTSGLFNTTPDKHLDNSPPSFMGGYGSLSGSDMDVGVGNSAVKQEQRLEWKRYKQYTRTDIQSAIQEVKNGMSALQASRMYKVPSRTLYDKVKKMGISTGRQFQRKPLPQYPNSLSSLAMMKFNYKENVPFPLKTELNQTETGLNLVSEKTYNDNENEFNVSFESETNLRKGSGRENNSEGEGIQVSTSGVEMVGRSENLNSCGEDERNAEIDSTTTFHTVNDVDSIDVDNNSCGEIVQNQTVVINQHHHTDEHEDRGPRSEEDGGGSSNPGDSTSHGTVGGILHQQRDGETPFCVSTSNIGDLPQPPLHTTTTETNDTHLDSTG